MEEPPGEAKLIDLGNDSSKETLDNHNAANVKAINTNNINGTVTSDVEVMKEADKTSDSVISTLTSISNTSYVINGIQDLYIQDYPGFIKKLKRVIKISTAKSQFLNPSTAGNVSVERIHTQYQECIKLSTIIKTYHKMLEDVIDNVSEDEDMFNLWLQIQTLDHSYETYKKGYVDKLDVLGEPMATSGKKVKKHEETFVPPMTENITLRKKVDKNHDIEVTTLEYRNMIAEKNRSKSEGVAYEDPNKEDFARSFNKSRPSLPIAGMVTNITQSGNVSGLKNTERECARSVQSPHNHDAVSLDFNSNMGYSNQRTVPKRQNNRSTTNNTNRNDWNSVRGDQVDIQVESTRVPNSTRMDNFTRDSFNDRSRYDHSRSVRFPVDDVERNDDVTDIESSWREIDYESDVLSELALMKTLRSIKKITLAKISDKLCDTEILAIEKNKRPGLERLNENLKKEVKDLPNTNSLLMKYAVEAFKSASEWIIN